MRGYHSNRLYNVDYHGFLGSHQAHLQVEASYTAPDKKDFTIISQSGSKLLINRVLLKLLESEKEAVQNRQNTELSPRNYEFGLLGTDREPTGDVYILSVKPRVNSKFLYIGKIWVDAHDFAVVHMEGEPGTAAAAGSAPFDPPFLEPAAAAAPGTSPRPWLTRESAPIGTPLTTRRVQFGPEDAAAYADMTDDPHPCYRGSSRGLPYVPPGLLASQPARLLRKTPSTVPAYTRSSEIHHLGPALAGGEYRIDAVIRETSTRRDNDYLCADVMIRDHTGALGGADPAHGDLPLRTPTLTIEEERMDENTVQVGQVTIRTLQDIRQPARPSLMFTMSTPEKLEPFQQFINERGHFAVNIGSFAVRSAGKLILVDTGIGNKDRPNYRNGRLPEALAEAGIAPDDVDIVLNTHMHIDHIGWNTVASEGRWVPLFPEGAVHLSTARMGVLDAARAGRYEPLDRRQRTAAAGHRPG